MAKFNEGQLHALEVLENFLSNDTDKVALLEGKPGTGKTFLLTELLRRYKRRAILTAPTNKATKVLKEMVTSDTYKPDTCTIYSLLKLQLSSDGEVKEIIAPDNEIDLSRYSLIIIDEALTIGSTLTKFIDEALENHNLKIIFIGDSYQLPPIKESKSAVWKYFIGEDKISDITLKLTQVMRHEGDILEAVNQIRAAIDTPLSYKLPFLQTYKRDKDDSDSSVVVIPRSQAFLSIKDRASKTQEFTTGDCKVIAWTNVVVDKYNRYIKSCINPNTYQESFWEIGDRIVVTQPCKDVGERTFARIDEEGTISKISNCRHPYIEEIDIHVVTCTMDDNTIKVFEIIHEHSTAIFNENLQALRQEALANKTKWRNYWAFFECVHHIRHAYAITAHRSQGSTFNTVYLDILDILKNKNRVESLQCLNVAASRAKDKLIVIK